MESIPVIAIFDVGKTNKKLFLFDEHYRIVYEKTARFLEVTDEDGFPCENIASLRVSVFDSLNEILRDKKFDVKAINFSTYGASFVYVDAKGNPLAPLYNYLKPYPKSLEDRFYAAFGGRDALALETASPCSGSLNSGLQLYRIKHEQPELFEKISYALHLPQYMSSLITGAYYSDITSIGCHTHLWDFRKKDYHDWVYKEQLDKKLASVFPSDKVVEKNIDGKNYHVGIGLHDSSAALIPYLSNFHEPFVLISTGTWCISLNPFNHTPLTQQEIQQNCLCYISYKGTPVKASRLFAGYEHEQETKRIAAHFHTDVAVFKTMEYDKRIIDKLNRSKVFETKLFADVALHQFKNITEAYHALMMFIVSEQYNSTTQVLQKGITKKIFVDGGFGRNSIYMNLLAAVFPDVEVYAASMAQATALGTALSIHSYWNSKPLPNDIIDLKYYSISTDENVHNDYLSHKKF